ncbi:MAG: T9SS type A sorting domain-containing protein [Sphingobacteriales bacterium]|nr:MAG: T9SS type A sorting domain-containing protein [Sphingobacteriales bacterium]
MIMKALLSILFVLTSYLTTNAVDHSQRIKRDGYGNVYVLGMYQGQISIDNFSYGDAMDNTSNSYNLFIAKFDTTGNFIWLHSFDGAIIASCSGLCPYYFGIEFDHNDDNFVIALNGADLNYDGMPIGDANLIKLDTAGNIIWTKKCSGKGWDDANIAIDRMDNIFYSGVHNEPLTIGNLSLPATGGIMETFIAKINSSGQELWINNIASFSGLQENQFITSDSAGNTYTGGMAMGEMVYGQDTINNGYFQIYLAKTNTDGEPQYLVQYHTTPEPDGALNTHFKAGVIAADGSLYVAGALSGTTVVNQTDTVHLHPNRNFYLAKTDPENGLAVWYKHDSIPSTVVYSEANSVTTDHSNQVFATGSNMVNGSKIDNAINAIPGDFFITFDSGGTFKCFASVNGISDGSAADEGYYTVSRSKDTLGAVWPRLVDIRITRWDKNSCIPIWQKSLNTKAFIVTVGIDEFPEFEDEHMLFPNPSSTGVFQKRNEKEWVGTKLSIVNALGQAVLFKENNSSIDLSENAIGIYYYKAIKGQKIKTGKLIYNR